MIVYKVVRNRNGKLKSALARLEHDRSREREIAQLTYCPGETTKPKFGEIFAFNTEPDARQFARRWSLVSPCEVWEAETSEAKPIEEIAGDGGYGCLSRFRAFWAGKPFGTVMPAPKGTVVCPQLSLRRRCDDAPVSNSS